MNITCRRMSGSGSGASPGMRVLAAARNVVAGGFTMRKNNALPADYWHNSLVQQQTGFPCR